MFPDTTDPEAAEAECRDQGQAGSRWESKRIGDRGGRTEDDAQEILISLFHNFNRGHVMEVSFGCDGSQQTLLSL
jgi:hypothetical protein